MFAVINQDTKRIWGEALDIDTARETIEDLERMFAYKGYTFFAQEMTREEIREYREYRKSIKGKLTFYETVTLDYTSQLVFLHLSDDTKMKLVFANEWDAEAYALRNHLEFIGSK